jgi:ribosomal protein S18 acetylase RimI-like enzyme
VREVKSPGRLIDDPIVAWAVQGLRDGVRVFSGGDAVAVASPDVSKHDRLAVVGPVADAVALTAGVLAEVGPSYRPFGDEDLIRALAEEVPGLTFSAAFGWMDAHEVPEVTTTAAWQDGDAGVEELLTQASPTSYAWPGHPGVRRWAAVTGEHGELLSIAADAWSAPEVGFLAGVATHPVARGKGLSRQVCGFVTAELVKRHGRAALMVDATNAAAIAVYHRLGYTYRRVAAASVRS